MENEGFELKNAANSTKMLQIPWEISGSNSKMLQMPLKWQLPAPKCCKWQGKRAEKTDPKKESKTEKT
jgi:hypothetical protein